VAHHTLIDDSVASSSLSVLLSAGRSQAASSWSRRPSGRCHAPQRTMLSYLLIALALALSLGTGHDLAGTASFVLQALTSWSTIQLLGIVTLVEMLTVLLQTSGALQAILTGLRRLSRDPRMLMALVPSIFGLMPIPGGAIISAPMVAAYGNDVGADSVDKSAINLYFRHVWDQAVPLKSHTILAAVVLNIPIFTLIVWQLPITAVAFVGGYWYLLSRRLSFHPTKTDSDSTEGDWPFWVAAAPLGVPLVLAPATGMDFLFAIGIGLIIGLLAFRPSVETLKKMAHEGFQPKLLFMLASVMLFKTVIEGTDVVKEVATAASALGLSVEVLSVILPLVVGYVTGLEVAVVAIVFPLLMAMVPAGTALLPYAILMMVANGVGAFLSPAHLCLAACNEYFCVDYRKVARLEIFPLALRLAVGLLVAWLVAAYWAR